MTHQTNQLYLVVHYVESHVRSGWTVLCESCVDAFDWISSSALYCFRRTFKYQVDVRAFQMILDDIHEVHHVGHKGTTREPMHGSQHGTSIDDDSIRYSVDPT